MSSSEHHVVMTRDPAVAALLAPLQATFRRMRSRARRVEYLSRQMLIDAGVNPLVRPSIEPQASRDSELRCVCDYSPNLEN